MISESRNFRSLPALGGSINTTSGFSSSSAASLMNSPVIGFVETDIFQIICSCVYDCIPHGIAVKFCTDNIACAVFGGNYADCADSAVGVKHGFVAFEICKFNCFAVQNFGLNGVNLVKAFRRNSEPATAENIFNITLAVQHFLIVTEYKVGAVGIYILHNGCDFGKLFQNRFLQNCFLTEKQVYLSQAQA